MEGFQAARWVVPVEGSCSSACAEIHLGVLARHYERSGEAVKLRRSPPGTDFSSRHDSVPFEMSACITVLYRNTGKVLSKGLKNLEPEGI